MRKRLIAGNWKLNGTWQLCEQFAESLLVSDPRVDVLICPPLVYLAKFSQYLQGVESGLQLGAQTVSTQLAGAYTGECSAAMLADAGATHCLVGHSERRALYGETDAQVAQKATQLLTASLTSFTLTKMAI